MIEHRPSMENEYYTFLSTCLSITFSWFLAVSRLTISFFVYGFHQKPNITLFELEKNNDVRVNRQAFLLDLPDLALECILEKLSPAELCVMASVCSYLKEKCVSDHLWEKHMKRKWGRLMGNAAIREWRRPNVHLMMKRVCSRKSERFKREWSLLFLSSFIKPFSWLNANVVEARNIDNGDGGEYMTDDSVMLWYLSLEHGKFLFPAQVYNREKGHVGFAMSCYDAKIRYDSKTDTFRARYSQYGLPKAEEIVTWDRLRSPPVDTPSRVLHVSDCLHDLKPGDHVEIQWRRTRDFPYGWWYGVVGHLENCDGDENCYCHSNDNVAVEFKQFRLESPWRITKISRKNHRETGDEDSGFYGGLIKLSSEELISTWKRFWPSHVLE